MDTTLMNLKRVIAVSAIGGTLALGLAACGSSEQTSTTAAATAAPTSSSSASPSAVASTAPTAPSENTSGVEEIVVPSGGFFVINEPAGVTAALAANPDGVNYQQTYDKSLVAPAMASDLPEDRSTMKTVGPKSAGTDGTTIWKTVGSATGKTDVVVTYTDPKSGETVKSAFVVVVK